MKHESRPAIHRVQPLLTARVGPYVGWDGASGDLQGGANSISQVASLRYSTSLLACGSVGEGSEKGQWPLPTFLSWRKLSPSSCLDARHFSSSLYATGTFQAPTLALELRGSVWISPCMVSFRDTAWDSWSFFHQLNPPWFLQPEVMETYLPGTGSLGWGTLCWAGTPCSQDISWIFIYHTWIEASALSTSPPLPPVWICSI